MRVSLITIAVQCNKLPSRVRVIASELEQLFKAANPQHPKVISKLNKPPQKTRAQLPVGLRLEDSHKQTLGKFKVPVDLANHDRNLFLAKYFLDNEGKPDHSKTPFTILLPGISDRLALQQAADTIPGLKTSSGGEGKFRVLVIGWKRAAIFNQTERISADQARLRDEMSPEWQERLRKHYNLIKMLPVPSKPGKLAIESAQGTYAVECRGVMDDYGGSENDDSDLRITYSKADGWVGIFNIGVIYGVMRLDTDRKALLVRCKATEENESRVDDHTGLDIPLEELETTEEENDASEEEDAFSDLSADEINEDEPGSPGFAVVARRKRRNAPTNAQNTSSKRSKLSPGTSTNRLYFKWRGREQGEGDVAHDGYKKNAGYLQFTDATCTKFESTISNDLIRKNVRFQGFKVSTEGGAVTRTYREYSERAGTVFND